MSLSGLSQFSLVGSNIAVNKMKQRHRALFPLVPPLIVESGGDIIRRIQFEWQVVDALAISGRMERFSWSGHSPLSLETNFTQDLTSAFSLKRKRRLRMGRSFVGCDDPKGLVLNTEGVRATF
jgi:hypothetical protein